MSIRKYLFFSQISAAFIAIVSLSACGGDDDTSTVNNNAGGTKASTGSSNGGSTGSSTSTAGSAGNSDWWRNLFDAAVLTQNCSETAPASLTCGGVACKALSQTLLFEAPCVQLCCAKDKSGNEVCGAKDTSKDAPEPCQAEPVADSRCPDYSADNQPGRTGGTAGSATSTSTAGTAGSAGSRGARDAGTTTVKGCCNPDNQCGIVSTIRPLCVTKSSLITLPATPKACNAQ
jgi:hypothetical protein